MRTAFYAGSFDPVTLGHLDVIARACRLVDRLVLAVGVHPGKTPMLSAEVRAELLRDCAGPLAAASGTVLEVITFADLTIEAARRAGAGFMVRGLRDGADLDDEFRLAGMNGAMAPDIDTVLLPASPGVRPIAATLVRQIAALGGDVSAFVPPAVAARLAALRG